MFSAAGTQQTQWQNNMPTTPGLTVWGTTVTAAAALHTKGVYSQLIASTNFDWNGFWLGVANTGLSATQTDMLLDIAIGGAASEQVLLPNLLCGWRGTQNLSPMMIFVPIFIARGTRIAARLQSLISSDTADVLIIGNAGASGIWGGPLFSGADAIGIDAGSPTSSHGTSVTPWSAGSPDSPIVSIGSAVTRHYGAIMLGIGGTLANLTQTNIAYHWKLCIGSQFVAQWYHQSHTTEIVTGPFPPTPFLQSIPNGTQLQVQATASGDPQTHDIAFYCFF